jgi:hypothetical protein
MAYYFVSGKIVFEKNNNIKHKVNFKINNVMRYKDSFLMFTLPDEKIGVAYNSETETNFFGDTIKEFSNKLNNLIADLTEAGLEYIDNDIFFIRKNDTSYKYYYSLSNKELVGDEKELDSIRVFFKEKYGDEYIFPYDRNLNFVHVEKLPTGEYAAKKVVDICEESSRHL